MSKIIYYVVPNIDVVEFRAMAGSYIRGVPQPTTVSGLVHAVSLKLAALTGMHLNKHATVAYGVSNWSGFSGVSRNARGSSSDEPAKRNVGGQIDDRVRASVRLSLIVEFVINDEDTAPTVEQFVNALEASRLQAGSMFVGRGARVVEDLATACRYLPTDCFMLVDASAETSEVVEDKTTTEAIASLISRPLDGEYKAHYAPVIVGWRELSEPAVRREQRPGALVHAFVEPAIGVARFMSRGSARALALSDTPALMWGYSPNVVDFHHVVVGAEPHTPEYEF